MKRLLLSSIALSMFAVSITVFQMSCKKEVNAQQGGADYRLPPATTTTLGGVIIGPGLNVSNDGTISISVGSGSGTNSPKKVLYERYHDDSPRTTEYWVSDYDGSNFNKIPISLPAGLIITGMGARLSPDGQFLFFDVAGENQRSNNIYRCKIDGTELTKVLEKSANDWYYKVLGVY